VVEWESWYDLFRSFPKEISQKPVTHKHWLSHITAYRSYAFILNVLDTEILKRRP